MTKIKEASGKQKGFLTKLAFSKSFGKYFANIGWLLFDKLFNLGVAFFVGVYVARYLGPENYGIINFGLSLTAFLAVFTGLGLNNVIARNFVRDQDRKNTILGTTLIYQLLASLLGIILLYFFSNLSGMEEKALVILMILSLRVIFEPFDKLLTTYFQSQVQSKKTIAVVIAKTTVVSLIKVYLVFTEQALEWFAVAYLIESIVAASGILIVYIRNGYSPFNWQFEPVYGKKLLGDSWPLLLSGFVIVVYLKIDTIMIKYMIGDAAVGIYSVAAKFTSIWFFAGGIICNSLLPSIVKTRQRDIEIYEKRLQHLFDLMMMLGLAIALPMTLLSNFIINNLYGLSYAEAASVLVIQVWSLVFIFMGNAASKWYLVENLQKSNLIRTIMGAVVNVSLNLILIPNYGIQGAAVATLLSQSVASFFGNSIGAHTRKIFWMQLRSLLFISLFKAKQNDNVFYFLKTQLRKS